MHCPICRAENDQGPNCRRCRADLESLFVLEKQRLRALEAAYRSLTAGQPRRAFALADGVRALRDDLETRQLSALSALLKRDFAAAFQFYQSCCD